MAEYIDIDAPVVVTDTRGRERETTVRHILKMNKGVYTAAAVRPVVRGRIEEDENTYLWCSECGCNITLAAYEMPNGNLILRPNFCPNCGAMMENSDEI